MSSESSAFAVVEVEQVPWWLVLIEGAAFLILGILLLTATQQTLVVLIQLLGIYWLVKGVFNIVSIFIDHAMWGWKLFIGIIGIIAGILVLQNPLWSAVFVPGIMVWILGIYAIIAGIFGIVLAFKGGGWGMGILGIFGILIGLVLLVNTLISLQIAIILAGVLAVIGGILAIIMAFRLR